MVRGNAPNTVAADPTRTCVVCRRAAPKSTLIRLVQTHESITVDRDQVLPGRGAYLCGRPACVDGLLGRRRRRLARALRSEEGAVTVEDQVVTVAAAGHDRFGSGRGVST